LEEYHRFFKRDNYFLTMKFKSRFSNSLAQGLSGKNEQHVWSPGPGPPEARGPMQLHRLGLNAGPGVKRKNNLHENEMIPTTNSIVTQRQVGCW